MKRKNWAVEESYCWENNLNGRWSGGQARMPSAFLLCSPSPPFVSSWYRAKGEGSSSTWMAQRASKAPALKLPVISFLCVNMCFLVRCVAARRKTGTQTALTSNYTAACLGGRSGWALVRWWGTRLNTPETEAKMARGRTLLRQTLTTLGFILF